MKELEIYQGYPQSWDLQCRHRITREPLTDLLDTDTVSSEIWVGNDQATLLTPATSFIGLASSGQITVAPTATESAMLIPNGEYLLLSFAARSAIRWPIFEGRIRVYPTPGSATRLTTTYCTHQDMLDIAPWIAGVQDVDVDQEGFYSQRLKARLWLDDIILNRFQGGYTGSYGAHSNDFGGSTQGIGPDPAMKAYLADDKLMRTPAVVEVCSHFAVAMVGLAQLGAGGGMSLAHKGSYHLAKAQRDVCAIVAQIDADGDGIGELSANLSTVAVTYG